MRGSRPWLEGQHSQVGGKQERSGGVLLEGCGWLSLGRAGGPQPREDAL